MSEKPVADYDFIHKIAALPFVEAIWLFGSRARGDNRARSDIDIGVKTENAPVGAWGEIDEIVENADTLLKIDCLPLNELPPDHYVWRALQRDGKLLFKRNPG